MLPWIAAAWAAECPTVEARVVGADPTGARVLLRFEARRVVDEAADPEGPGGPPGPPAITLRAIDVPSGAVAREWTILREEDRGSPAVRAANWARAEAEATALGLRITPERTPLWDAGAQCANDAVPLRVGDAEVMPTDWRAANASGGLGVRVTRGGVQRSQVVAEWPPGASPALRACLRSVWGVPGDRAVIVVAQRACLEPLVAVVPL